MKDEHGMEESASSGVDAANAKPRTFEDLWVWQESRKLVVDIYHDFAEGTPGCRDYSFRDQIQSAGISTMNNAAEGFERESIAEYAHLAGVAKGSAGEVRSMYYAAEDLHYVTPEIALNRRTRAKRISQGLSNLIKRLKTRR